MRKIHTSAIFNNRVNQPIQAQIYMSSFLIPSILLFSVLFGVLLFAWFFQREKVFKEEINRLEATLTGLDVLLMIVDRDLVIKLFNTRFRDSLFNVKDDKLRNGLNALEVFPEWMHKDIQTYIGRAFGGKTVVTEKMIGEGRKQQKYEIAFTPIYVDSKSGANSCSIAIKDVTELSITHHLLYEAKRDAIDAAKAKADFLSTMSHEIRTPMNAVLGLTNLLLMENPREDQKDHLETIRFSGNNLLHIINDILDYNKIESGNLTLEHIDFNLHEMLEKLTRVLRNKADSKNVYLKVEIGEEVPEWIKGDQVRLNQVITNLIGNAIKFTSEGGVTLKLSVLEGDQERKKVRFEVIDTGIGIPKDKQKAIFERFTQAETDTTRNYGGTGLGLAICKRLTEAFESKLMLDSTPGKGSNFYFDMFVEVSVSPESLESASNPEHIEKDLRGGKILLAEDNEINVLVIGEYLKQWNAKFEVAENGKIAVEMAQSDVYDLVLMDLQMPEMDGYEATKQIRALEDPIKSALPIYALTADAMVEIKERVMEVGMNGIFHKPFDPESVYRTLYREIIGN